MYNYILYTVNIHIMNLTTYNVGNPIIYTYHLRDGLYQP